MYVKDVLPIKEQVKIVEMVVGKGLCPLLIAKTFNVELSYVEFLIKKYYGYED